MLTLKNGWDILSNPSAYVKILGEKKERSQCQVGRRKEIIKQLIYNNI
jgi:hypothetical protein